MNKKAIIILLLLSAIINSANAEMINDKDENTILKAFEASKSEFTSFNKSFSGEINNEFMDFKTLEQVSKDLTENIEFKETYREVTEESKMNKISIYGQAEEGCNITFIFYSYSGEANKTTIFIDINETKDYKRIREMASKISKTLEGQGIKAEITSCIIGSYDRKLTGERKMEIIKTLINVTNSSQIESLVNDEVFSYSLYSKNIENYIYTGENKMNLSIAINYNEYNNKTNIFIATPIITMGY